MVRGPRHHLKRLNAPKHWMLSKLGGIWAPRPSAGPHKLRECLPVSLILRNRLKFSLNRRETLAIVMRRLIEIDGKVRTDINFPAGFMDVIRIRSVKKALYRLLYDVKGRFRLVPINEKKAAFKLCRVVKISKRKKTTIGRNICIKDATKSWPFAKGQAAAIPYIVTHDGRTINYPHPDIKVNDVIKLNLKTGKIEGFLKFVPDQLAMATKGSNIGRVGKIQGIERHDGSFNIVHLRDSKGNSFATRIENVFLIGDAEGSWVTLPKAAGIKSSIFEDRDLHLRVHSKK